MALSGAQFERRDVQVDLPLDVEPVEIGEGRVAEFERDDLPRQPSYVVGCIRRQTGLDDRKQAFPCVLNPGGGFAPAFVEQIHRAAEHIELEISYRGEVIEHRGRVQAGFGGDVLQSGGGDSSLDEDAQRCVAKALPASALVSWSWHI